MAIITISRGTSTGGKELAQSVAERLSYKLVAEEVLVNAAKEYGMAVEQVKHAIKDKPGFFESMGSSRVHAMAFVAAALSKEIKNEKVVYHGHAGHLFLRGVPHVLRVRVIASMEYRIKKAMEQHDFDWQQAADYIKKADDTRVRWSQFLFHVDTRDPSLYDLIIDVDRINIAGACDIVCTAAGLERFQKTAESQERLDNFILSTEIRAAVAKEIHICDDHIEINAHNGIVELSGSVHSLEEADELREFVCKYPGVKDIQSHLKAPIQTRIRW
jgi:cytidylate kinase